MRECSSCAATSAETAFPSRWVRCGRRCLACIAEERLEERVRVRRAELAVWREAGKRRPPAQGSLLVLCEAIGRAA